MQSQLPNIGFKKSPVELIALGIAAILFFVIIAFGGEKIVVLLMGLCGAFVFFLVAYHKPAAMVALWALSTQVMVEVIIWDYSKYIEPSLNIGGGIDMLYGDPILFSMMAAMMAKLLTGDPRAKRTIYKEMSIWSIFMLWMIFELARSASMFGLVSPLGEFRTYFREILIIPYIVIFASTREEQWKMFKVLLWVTLCMIPIGIFRGAYVHKFTFHAYAKWLYQHGSLGLVWGTLGVYLMQRYGYWKYGNFWSGLLIAVAMGLTVIASHRSVWLAAMVSMLVLFMMGHLKMGNLMKMGAAALTAVLILNFAVEDLDLAGYIEHRLVALTNPTEDETANWRYLIWMDAIKQSSAHLLEGKGLGNYFMMRAPNGLIVTKMLHNQYVQLLYQVGLIGLVLYIAMVTQMYFRLSKVYKESQDLFYKMTSLLAMVIIFGSAAYLIAYDFEPFTWMFVGLGMAISVTHTEHKIALSDYYRSMQKYYEANPNAGYIADQNANYNAHHNT